MAEIQQPQSRSTETNAAPMEESEKKSPADSSISELQQALGTLLVCPRDKSDTRAKFANAVPWDVRARRQKKLKSEPTVHKWTGAFRLFDFPRELRDKIYHYYLYRPDGVRVKRNATRCFPFDHSEALTNLFVANKQVYHEAYEVFCASNEIKLGGLRYCSKNNNGSLRLFPERPARLLQIVSKEYYENTARYTSRDGSNLGTSPSDAFLQIISDAYTLKSFFPRLRRLTAIWDADPWYFEQHGLKFDEMEEEDKVHLWLRWMRTSVEAKKMAPPRWLRFKFCHGWHSRGMAQHDTSLNEAYARILDESRTMRDEEKMLEESGKRWLEEMAMFAKRQRKRRDKKLMNMKDINN